MAVVTMREDQGGKQEGSKEQTSTTEVDWI